MLQTRLAALNARKSPVVEISYQGVADRMHRKTWSSERQIRFRTKVFSAFVLCKV
jgi:hypothetical protein